MSRIVGIREVSHQPVFFDFGRGRVWGGNGGMWARQGITSGIVAGGQAPEGGMVLGGLGRSPSRTPGAWGAPRRGLGRIGLSSRTRSGIASGVMTSAVWMLGLPAAIGAGVAYLKKKDEDTITHWAVWGGLIGLGVQALAALAIPAVAAWVLGRAAQNPTRLVQSVSSQAGSMAGLGSPPNR